MIVGASVSEPPPPPPPLSAANGDFVGACVRTSVRMHGPYTANTSNTYFNGIPSLTLAPQCSAFSSNILFCVLCNIQPYYEGGLLVQSTFKVFLANSIHTIYLRLHYPLLSYSKHCTSRHSTQSLSALADSGRSEQSICNNTCGHTVCEVFKD